MRPGAVALDVLWRRFAFAFAAAPRRFAPTAWLYLVAFVITVVIAYRLQHSGLADLWDRAPMLGLTIATLLVSTACAVARYYLVERPLLRLKRTRVSEPATPPAPAAAVGQPARSAG